MRARTWSTEFKQFLLRGNVIDLAVGIVIGAAFGGMVQALVKDLLTPLVAAIFGSPDFSRLSFRIHHSVFFYGDFPIAPRRCAFCAIEVPAGGEAGTGTAA